MKNLKEEYEEYKVHDTEGLVEWFLKRKLGFWGKMMFSILLFSLGAYLVTNPKRMLYSLYMAVALSLVVTILEFCCSKNKK